MDTVTEFTIAVSVATRWIDWIMIRLASLLAVNLGVVHNVVNIGSSLCFRFFFQRFNQVVLWPPRQKDRKELPVFHVLAFVIYPVHPFSCL